jgi:ribosomal protein S18 acetylase RimI-like enzyme
LGRGRSVEERAPPLRQNPTTIAVATTGVDTDATRLLLAEYAQALGIDLGYRAVRLDALPSMEAAQRLYRRLGFRAIGPYRFNPVSGTAFMELVLDGQCQ